MSQEGVGTRPRPKKVFLGEVYDFSDPCWGVSYPDGDWEELDRQEIIRGKELATASI